jgi:purine-binding chemotaxis protein CheW
MKRRRSGDVPIDWDGVRKRLAEAQAATDAAENLTPERARAIMDERARLLARRPVEIESGDSLDVLTFALGAERYGVEMSYVREVVRLGDLTRVPDVPEYILGVTNLRGEVLCIVDLRKFLDAPSTGVTDLSRIVVLGTDRAEFGVLADRADAIVGLRAAELLPPFESTAAGHEYVRGVTRDALIVLDGAALLRDPRLFIDDAGSG